MKGIERGDMWGDYLILALLDWCWLRPRRGEGEDYRRLLEHLWRRLFKDGIIRNIQQCLSALCKESYPRPPSSTSTLSLTSLQSLHRLPVSNKLSHKARRLTSSSEAGDWTYRRRGVFVFSAAARLAVNDFLPDRRPLVTSPDNQAAVPGAVGLNGTGETATARDKNSRVCTT